LALGVAVKFYSPEQQLGVIIERVGRGVHMHETAALVLL